MRAQRGALRALGGAWRTLAAALQSAIGRTRALLDGLKDTVLQARSNASGTATTAHSFLGRLAKKNGALKGELSVISGAFKINRKAKADAVGGPAATAALAPTGATAPVATAAAIKAS